MQPIGCDEPVPNVKVRKPVSSLKLWMGFATMLAGKSTALDKQVGCIAIDANGNILGYGFNHCTDDDNPETEDENGKTKDTTLHAEDEMLQRAAELGHTLDGATVFITHSPCLRCAGRLKRAKVRRIYYFEDFKQGISHDFFNRHGIDLIQVLGANDHVDRRISEAEDDEDDEDIGNFVNTIPTFFFNEKK